MADKTPKTLSGIEETVKVDGKDTKLTVVTTYTPEKMMLIKSSRLLRDLLKLKNSDGDVLLEYNGATNKFTATSDASDDLKQQVSNYQIGKPSPYIKHLVQVSAAQISNDSGISAGNENNTAFIVTKNNAFLSEAESTAAAQIVSKQSISLQDTLEMTMAIIFIQKT